MKRLIIAAVLLLACVTLAVYSNALFNKTTDEMIDGLYTLVDLSQKNDLSALNGETEKFLSRWNKSSRTLHMLTIHSEMSTAESSVNSLADLLENGEMQEFRMACIKCISELKNLKNSEKISVDNIL